MLRYDGDFALCIGNRDARGNYAWVKTGKPDWTQWDAIGFGAVAIHRRIFEWLGTFTPFEPWIMTAEGQKTEDVRFCERVKERYRPWTHPKLVAGHWRTVDLTLLQARQLGIAAGRIEA